MYIYIYIYIFIYIIYIYKYVCMHVYKSIHNRIVHLPSGGGVAVLSRALYLTPYARAQYSKGALDYFYLSEESPSLRAASAFVC